MFVSVYRSNFLLIKSLFRDICFYLYLSCSGGKNRGMMGDVAKIYFRAWKITLFVSYLARVSVYLSLSPIVN